jgi:cytosine/adenosine deaminase-related metal-dependent hydrolase
MSEHDNEYVITGVYALTMDEALGDVPAARLHIRDGVIVSVAAEDPAVPVAGRVLDGRGLVALPGLVDTHNHLWSGSFRSLVRDGRRGGYNELKATLGPRFRPADTYAFTVLGLTESLNAGITTVHNWAHNTRDLDHAQASTRAQFDCGLRGRFSYGAYEGLPRDQPIRPADIDALRAGWAGSGALFDFGFALRGPALTDAPVYRAEWEAAAARRLPVSIHYASSRTELADFPVLDLLAEDDLLTMPMQLVHALYTTERDRAAIAGIGAHVSSAPLACMRHGLGFSPIRELRASGIGLSLSLDSAGLAGSLDMFAVMRALLLAEHARHEDDEILSARDVLAMATTGGAGDLGLAGQIGSLTPGKRADLILVDLSGLNTGPFPDDAGIDPATLIAYAAAPANVHTVIVDGRVRKRDGRLTGVAVADTVAAAREALTRILRTPA